MMISDLEIYRATNGRTLAINYLHNRHTGMRGKALTDPYQQIADNIPWASFGRETSISQVGKGLLPVGIVPANSPMWDDPEKVHEVSPEDPNFESFLMDIAGTAIQAGDGKLVTCRHVVQAVPNHKQNGYVLIRIHQDNTVAYVVQRFTEALHYIDPRTMKVNQSIDLAVIPLPVDPSLQAPAVQWGESAKIGVGDPVILGGYPFGKDLFLMTKSNRGAVQPTFYPGIVSAVIPATKAGETRLLQISASVAGGISGGAVINPSTGEVLGMVTSGLDTSDGTPLPMTYALPSEIIAPYARAFNYETPEGRRGMDT